MCVVPTIVLNEIFVNNCIIIISVDSSMNMVGINFSLIYIYNQIWCGFNLLYSYKQKCRGFIFFFCAQCPAMPCLSRKTLKEQILLREKGEGLRHRNPTNR